eukprot:scaffold557721_cov37-Prasinocladus_malaysianus.AAC.1
MLARPNLTTAAQRLRPQLSANHLVEFAIKTRTRTSTKGRNTSIHHARPGTPTVAAVYLATVRYSMASLAAAKSEHAQAF